MRQAAAVLASATMPTSLHELAAPAMVVHGEPDLGNDLPAAVAWDLIDRIIDFHSSRVVSR